MAANLDRAETSLTAVSDIAYIRGIDGSGNSVRISKADLASVLGAIAAPLTLIRSGSGTQNILDLCKSYWDSMAADTCVFIHMESTTTSFGFILKGSMGTGVGIIKMIKGATGEVISYSKKYNSDEWVESTF